MYEEIGASAMLVVFDGAVLAAWGDVKRRYMCHSIRKSFLSALLGIHVDEGRIDLNRKLADLNIDDDPPLTKKEKQARIVHLLKSRSGIYHPAAYETPLMKERRPKRGSKKPGEFWYYNNWDFNALGTIFEQSVNTSIFQEFQKRFAEPLQMEDFNLMHTNYHLEKQHSIHPAYPFRMSARDMARFGLLFIRNGKWKDQELISPAWVKASQQAYSKSQHWSGYGYGYMWWVNIDKQDRKFGMYAAMGYGGHTIAILPGENLVVVNRTNTYLGDIVDKGELLQLIDTILNAKTKAPKANPKLIALEKKTGKAAGEPPFPVYMDDYVGLYEFDSEMVLASTILYVIGDIIGKQVRIEIYGERLLMSDSLGQKYFLLPRSQTAFVIEDMEVEVRFEKNVASDTIKITLDARSAWSVSGKQISASVRRDP
ncbi:hypothetical protein ES703_31078 [subsurface metagenome]